MRHARGARCPHRRPNPDPNGRGGRRRRSPDRGRRGAGRVSAARDAGRVGPRLRFRAACCGGHELTRAASFGSVPGQLRSLLRIRK